MRQRTQPRLAGVVDDRRRGLCEVQRMAPAAGAERRVGPVRLHVDPGQQGAVRHDGAGDVAEIGLGPVEVVAPHAGDAAAQPGVPREGWGGVRAEQLGHLAFGLVGTDRHDQSVGQQQRREAGLAVGIEGTPCPADDVTPAPLVEGEHGEQICDRRHHGAGAGIVPGPVPGSIEQGPRLGERAGRERHAPQDQAALRAVGEAPDLLDQRTQRKAGHQQLVGRRDDEALALGRRGRQRGRVEQEPGCLRRRPGGRVVIGASPGGPDQLRPGLVGGCQPVTQRFVAAGQVGRPPVERDRA